MRHVYVVYYAQILLVKGEREGVIETRVLEKRFQAPSGMIMEEVTGGGRTF